MIEINFPVKQIPEYVRKTAKTIISAGFEAFIVGGAVRDLLIEKPTKDYDISTNALPEEIIELFPKCISTGSKFGNIIVLAQDQYGERYDVDVTTYRKEEDYFGGRWPTKVEFTSSIQEDLSRRDFTINALALDLNLILSDQDQFIDISKIIDPFGGINDLQNKLIKAVGVPSERFKEDGLRAFRACRLASELNFNIDPRTKAAIIENKVIANKISMERIRDELLKMIKHSKKPSIGIRLLDEVGLLKIILPELIENKDIVQPQWHNEDVYNHSLKTMDIAEDEIKIAALLHDIGKARTKVEDEKGIHFYGHDKLGAKMAKEILTRLRFPNHEIKRISNLIKWHMFYYPSADWRKEDESSSHNYSINIESLHSRKDETKTFFSTGWSDSAIRRFIKNVGGDEQIDQLIKLRIADAESNEKSEFNPKEIRSLEKRIAEVREKEMFVQISDLDIDGEDLIDMGYSKGPEIGNILNKLLDLVIDDPNLNSKEKLLNAIKNFT